MVLKGKTNLIVHRYFKKLVFKNCAYNLKSMQLNTHFVNDSRLLMVCKKCKKKLCYINNVPNKAIFILGHIHCTIPSTEQLVIYYLHKQYI